MRTRLTELLDIEHPVMLAGMGGVSYHELVAAVSNAGGFGCLGASAMGTKRMIKEMQDTKTLTDKPFGVDLLTAAGDLTPQVEAIIKEGGRVFVAGLGVPRDVVDLCHKNGVLVVSMCGKVHHALLAVEAGCDIVVAQGTEAGGHTGTVATMPLVPQIVDAVDGRALVVAAGGIVDGRGLAAALCLGADGVWIGARFIATPEAQSVLGYKEKLLALTDDGTTVSRAYTGKTCRVIRNEYTQYWEDNPADLQKFPGQIGRAMEDGVFHMGGDLNTEGVDPEKEFFPAGQGAGAITSLEPAGDIVRKMVSDAESMPREASSTYRVVRSLGDGMTDDELVALGLCDADKLHTSRPAFIRMLLEQGATVEEVQDAAKHSQARLWSLSVALQLYAPGRVGLEEASERTGASIDEIREWWHDYGWPDPALPDATFNEWDLQLLEIMTDRIPLGILPRPVVSDFLRTATTAVAALAESMLNSLRIGLDQPARERGDSSVEVARAREILELLLPDFFGAIQILFRRAVVTGAATDITINTGGEIWSERTLVFVDLVDYSTIAQGSDLRDALDQFEIAVSSCATDYGGRLVKLLGDGAMLTFTSRDEAISAATSLVRDAALPPCRAGVATGPVMLRHADFFGPVVNLASRLSTVVEAGEVAVDDSTEVLNSQHMAPIHLKGLDRSVTPYRIAPRD